MQVTSQKSCSCIHIWMLHELRQGPEPKPKLKGDTRTFRVWLDPNQYQQDMTNSIQNGEEDPYETFNIIMRRKPKENNFKVGRLLLIDSLSINSAQLLTSAFYFCFSGCAGDYPQSHEHWVRGTRLASWHYSRLWRSRKCTLLQNAESDFFSGLQRHLPVHRTLEVLLPRLYCEGHRGGPCSSGPAFQVRGHH